MAKNPTIKELKNQLGNDYEIYWIDLEKCLYRDYGNGFDLEISAVSHANRNCPASLYLWINHNTDYYMVKSNHNVGRTADAIHAAAEEMYELSQKLIARGCTDKKTFLKMKADLEKEGII